MPRQVQLILGPPGTGKTTYLLNIVNKCIAADIPPWRIAFVAFTRKAANEAMHRAMSKFNLTEQQLPYFRTLHSITYRQLGITRDAVMGRNDYREIAIMLGTKFKGYSDMTEGELDNTAGDAMLQLIGIARATKRELWDVWQEHEDAMPWHELKLFDDTINRYKENRAKVDFADMLHIYTKERLAVDVDVAIIDEAQDLSNAQWDMCKCAFRKAGKVYIAGDDDQAIYEWSGANVNRLLGIKADKKVLDKTYRLPKAVYDLAIKIVGRIGKRFEKQWAPLDKAGSVSHINDVYQLPIKPGEQWMLLGRNGYMLNQYVEMCESVGIPYETAKGPRVDPEHITLIRAWETFRKGGEVDDEQLVALRRATKKRTGNMPTDLIWHDALISISAERREYYLACLQNGYKLHQPIYIGTVHSVKGGEADNVALLTDLSWKTYCGYNNHPDAEHRVFFVAVTRTKNSLYIVDPQTDKSYAI